MAAAAAVAASEMLDEDERIVGDLGPEAAARYLKVVDLMIQDFFFLILIAVALTAGATPGRGPGAVRDP